MGPARSRQLYNCIARSIRCRRINIKSHPLGDLTELFGVRELTRPSPVRVSLGERMKMELIASLCTKTAALLLLDEPTIRLDVIAQVTIQKCLRDLQRIARRHDTC